MLFRSIPTRPFFPIFTTPRQRHDQAQQSHARVSKFYDPESIVFKCKFAGVCTCGSGPGCWRLFAHICGRFACLQGLLPAERLA